MTLGTMVVVRHGEAEGNIDDRFWKDDILNFLTHRGTLQAQLAGVTLRDMNMSFENVLCSPMLRARQTCSHIIQNAGIKIPVQVIHNLQECTLSEGSTNLTTLEAATQIKELRTQGNILVVMHYFSMMSLVRNFGLEMPWQGGQNAVLNIINENNTMKHINGNQNNPTSHGN